MLTSKLFDRVVPKSMIVNEEEYSVTPGLSTNTQTFVFANSTPTTLVTTSAAGSNGMLPLKGAQLLAVLEGVVAVCLKESATAEAYATPLVQDTDLLDELASNLYDALESMTFYSNIE